MSNLKELTKEQHTNAERQDFVKVLMSGKINPEFYALYLWNQLAKYDVLEACAMGAGLYVGFPDDMRRKPRIEQDFFELWTKDSLPDTVPSTKEYVDHILSIKNDPVLLMAHIYTLHMGDLSGGQMIARKVPGQGMMYNFESDKNELRDMIRGRTTDDMAEEAKVCFSYASKLFQELMRLNVEHYMEPSD